jgi:hypothetical protein
VRSTKRQQYKRMGESYSLRRKYSDLLLSPRLITACRSMVCSGAFGLHETSLWALGGCWSFAAMRADGLQAPAQSRWPKSLIVTMQHVSDRGLKPLISYVEATRLRQPRRRALCAIGASHMRT